MMKTCRKGNAVWGLLGGWLLCNMVGVSEAGAPMDQMRQTIDRLIDVLQDETLSAPERRTHIRQVLSQRFAYAAMAQKSLGRHWKTLTAKQQQAFIPLFSSLLESEHTKRVEKFGGDERNVVFSNETLNADGTASVEIEITDPRDPTTNEEVEYRLRQQNSTWLVHDLLLDGASMVTNYRTQFDRIIRQESFAELVRRLQRSSASVDKID